MVPTLLACLLVLLVGSSTPAAQVRRADLVLKNGIVHTLDPARPTAQAVAIEGNRIAAVGTDAELAAHIGPGTRVIDLAGATVLPGLVDAHAHLLGVGFAKLSVDLVGTKSWAEAVERVATAARTRPAGEWIVGRGWHEEKWTEPTQGAVRGFPTHEALSAACPDHPVYLSRADGHAAMVNARAMQLSKIGPDTRPPAGGEIIRDAQGRATGVFVDNAERLVQPPPPSDAQRRRALEVALQEALAQGLTGFHDAGADWDDIALYKEFAARGRLPVRLYVMLAGLDTLRRFERPEVGLGHGMLTLRTVKLYADGALGSRGAALLEPYADDPGNSGFLTTPAETLLEATRLALTRGFQVATHAIGDRGNRVVLDTYQQALREHPEARDPRLRIEHAQVLDAADIPRFGTLGVIAAMQGIHATSDRPWAADRLGMARVTEGAYAWRKLLASGARIVNGTDAPVESLSPVKSFYASVTRQDESGKPPGGFDRDQRMTRPEALRSYTLDPAYASFQEKDLGAIQPGRLADLSVLSSDILTVPEPEILRARVLWTIVDGQIRYAAQR